MSPSYPLPPELPNAFNVVPIQLTPDPLPESKDEGFVPSTQFLVSIDGRLVPGDQLNVVFQPGADSDVIEALLAQEKLTRVYWSVKGDSASYQVVVLPEGASVVTVASTLRQNPLVKSIDYIALIFAD